MFRSSYFTARYFNAPYWGKAGAIVIPMELSATFAIQTRLAASLDGQPQMSATLYEQSRLAATVMTDRN